MKAYTCMIAEEVPIERGRAHADCRYRLVSLRNYHIADHRLIQDGSTSSRMLSAQVPSLRGHDLTTFMP